MATSSHDSPPLWRTYILGILVYLLLGLVIIVGMNWWFLHDPWVGEMEGSEPGSPVEQHLDETDGRSPPRSGDREPTVSGLQGDSRKHAASANGGHAGNPSELSPTMRRILWEELILADRRAHAPVASDGDGDPRSLLAEGQEIRLTQRMAIWPVYGYHRRSVTAGGRRELPAGTTVVVEDLVRQDGTVWYGVDALSPEHIHRGYGWVEHEVLASQLPKDFHKRPDRAMVQTTRLELYERELMVKFGVTRETLAAIRREGRSKQWPVPPVESEINGS